MKTKHAGRLGLSGALVIVGLCWWLETRTRPGETVAPHTLGAVSVGGSNARTPTPLGNIEREDGADRAGGQMAEPAAAEETPRLTVGNILTEPDDDFMRVAKKLSELVLDARAPMAEREEALAHALNLSAGNETEVLTPLLKHPNLPDSFAETILSEALNRELARQADLYLAALATRKTPELQKIIRGHLAFLAGGPDRGPRPEDWQEAIKAAKASWPE